MIDERKCPLCGEVGENFPSGPDTKLNKMIRVIRCDDCTVGIEFEDKKYSSLAYLLSEYQKTSDAFKTKDRKIIRKLCEARRSAQRE
jgi:predicted RNA-binding protein YlxR (DUF448 family)